MGKVRTPVTQAVRALRAAGINYGEHPYLYEEHGSTAVCARELSVNEHLVIKTLVMQDDRHRPIIVLMHGDMEVSTKKLSRAMGVKLVSPASPEAVRKLTGYQVGGTSPFGTARKLPVYMERTIMDLPDIYINGGSRGFLVSMSPNDAFALLEPELVSVAIG